MRALKGIHKTVFLSILILSLVHSVQCNGPHKKYTFSYKRFTKSLGLSGGEYRRFVIIFPLDFTSKNLGISIVIGISDYDISFMMT